MDKHDKCIKGFSQLSKAYYAKVILPNSGCVDEINIGFYANEGGTTGEFSIKWVELAGKIVPKLSVFDDAWSALANMPELISILSELDDTNPSPDQLALKLQEVGFKNMTLTEEK